MVVSLLDKQLKIISCSSFSSFYGFAVFVLFLKWFCPVTLSRHVTHTVCVYQYSHLNRTALCVIGKILIYDLRSGSSPVKVLSSAHKSSVQCLSFQSSGSKVSVCVCVCVCVCTCMLVCAC